MKPNQVKVLDELFGKIIRLRANGFCEHCGLWAEFEGIDPSHYIGRSNKHLRWNEYNVYGLAHKCHDHFDNHKSEYTAWVINRLGTERFEQLLLKSNSLEKLDYITIKSQLQQRIKELQR